MKIYAKQVPPVYQESPLFYGPEFWPDDVFVFGNRDYKSHCEELDHIRAGMEDAANDLEDLQSGNPYGYTWDGCLFADLTPDKTRGAYTRAERLQWIDILNRYFTAPNSTTENAILCEALGLIKGIGWEYDTIRGCCQGDWQEIIYPAEYGPDWLYTFENEYFNLGSEWTVYEDGNEEDNFSMYCHEWNDDGLKKEIANAQGCTPEEVTLLKFTGWTRSAQYEEV